MKKIYAYSYKLFKCLSFIGFTLFWLYMGLYVEELIYKIISFVFTLVSCLAALDCNFHFYKKIIKKEDVIVKRKNFEEILSGLLYYSLLIISLWLKTSYKSWGEFNFLVNIIYTYIAIDLTFIILNMFLGTKVIESNNKEIIE
ncbi:hypothetical protein KHQ81_13450 [Mycoplasmatota bacterium]|nr:hypothetical protein KHQ81_13450 [Mycoplasmatota bacterium]